VDTEGRKEVFDRINRMNRMGEEKGKSFKHE